MKQFRVPEIVFGALIGIVISLFAAGVGSYQAEHCEQAKHTEAQAPEPKHEIPASQQKPDRQYQVEEQPKHAPHFGCGAAGLIPSFIGFMDAHEGFFVGSFTLALVFATIFLWKSTNALYEAGETALTVSERAYVYLDGFDFELTVASDAKEVDIRKLPEPYRDCPELYITRFAVFPRWKNSGSTPTKSMVVWTKWDGVNSPVILDFTTNFSGSLFFLGPHATNLGDIVEIPPARSLVDWSMTLQGAAPQILIWGRGDYEDVFRKRHFVEWCYELRFSRPDTGRMRPSFIQRGEYCRTDDGQHS